MNDEHAYYSKFIALSKEAAEKMADISEGELDLMCHCLAAGLRQADMLLREKFDKETSEIIMETYGKIED